MNYAYSIVMLSVAIAFTSQADEIKKLKELGAGIFKKNGVVREINLNRSKIIDSELKLLITFTKLTDLSLEQTKITGNLTKAVNNYY